ncbi:dihydrolipoyl dehydrogenase family protein [Amycolatopsis sp. H20-H5]|uniref:dihydrolipoyl dehydrogenase family protein n=1 Tax=Amycolatopsis sp. H20-H5 TaxID=3046309 RepID=UPI002DB5D02F|nr:FAD-dependent oxidoreductase [Amycolatopsis sp. H20-H5]MEC3975851.1 FAD-dependent oxidoreductase [Amycolatopsis sp. H20-H5]
MADRVDLVIIGGGTAGIIAAKTAAGLGADVVLVERHRTGGDCLWTGCVPSKALIAAAKKVRATRTANRFVTTMVAPDVDFTAVMAYVHQAIERIEPVDSPQALRDAGADVILGDAVFTGPDEVQVGTQRLRFRHALIATGSSPALPPVPGLPDIEPLTSDTVWELTRLPRRLVVLGGGPIGCELAQAFARLGSEVTIIETLDRLIPREEPAASAVLTARLREEGVRVLTGTTVIKASGAPPEVELETTGTDGTVTLTADQMLVATGRRPRTDDLGLTAAGVDLDAHGYVNVDTALRTSNPAIYAGGDVTGGPAFTHVAGIHGSIAASNAVLGPFRRTKHDTMPWVTFTDPEIAHVGLTEAQARQRHGDTVRVRVHHHSHVDRAITDEDTDGFTHVVLDGKGRILGGTIVAPRAGEMLAELSAVLAKGGRLRDIGPVVHAYPTWADSVWNAALDELSATLATPAIRRATEVLRRARKTIARR